jgi:NAD(P)-dependent dehydrogenase (short-subunit alcohol dehydrogenase family)
MDSSELTRLYDFSGQTVVITGGTGTLGGEIACALVGCGANVAILDRNLDPAQHILELMEPRANQAVAVRADVLDPESLRQAAKVILDKFGTIHSLVNAAGGNKPQATTGPDLSFFDLPPDALRWVFDLNILGTMLPCQRIPPSDPSTGLLGREGRGQQFYAVARRAHGSGLFAADSRQRHCAGFLPHPTKQVSVGG